MKPRNIAALTQVLAALLFVLIVGTLFWRGRSISLRKTAICQSLPTSTALSLEQELSRYHPDGVLEFAVPYNQGRNLISVGSIDRVWLYQIVRNSGWDVDWFQTDVDLRVKGFCIVVNDLNVLPPEGLALARILSHHSVEIKWIADPRIVSWTNDWCVYVGC
jgi:hypothetical protein